MQRPCSRSVRRCIVAVITVLGALPTNVYAQSITARCQALLVGARLGFNPLINGNRRLLSVNAVLGAAAGQVPDGMNPVESSLYEFLFTGQPPPRGGSDDLSMAADIPLAVTAREGAGRAGVWAAMYDGLVQLPVFRHAAGQKAAKFDSSGLLFALARFAQVRKHPFLMNKLDFLAYHPERDLALVVVFDGTGNVRSTTSGYDEATEAIRTDTWMPGRPWFRFESTAPRFSLGAPAPGIHERDGDFINERLTVADKLLGKAAEDFARKGAAVPLPNSDVTFPYHYFWPVPFQRNPGHFSGHHESPRVYLTDFLGYGYRPSQQVAFGALQIAILIDVFLLPEPNFESLKKQVLEEPHP